jgi:regulator of replication initiation timing
MKEMERLKLELDSLRSEIKSLKNENERLMMELENLRRQLIRQYEEMASRAGVRESRSSISMISLSRVTTSKRCIICGHTPEECNCSDCPCRV